MRPMLAAGTLLLAACGSEEPTPGVEQPAQLGAPGGTSSPLSPPVPQQDLSLLQSEAVKDAIHRALVTGENQRWQDGELSGYAVPSLTPFANGCRTIRYTVDQRPDGPIRTINACEGTPR